MNFKTLAFIALASSAHALQCYVNNPSSDSATIIKEPYTKETAPVGTDTCKYSLILFLCWNLDHVINYYLLINLGMAALYTSTALQAAVTVATALGISSAAANTQKYYKSAWVNKKKKKKKKKSRNSSNNIFIAICNYLLFT